MFIYIFVVSVYEQKHTLNTYIKQNMTINTDYSAVDASFKVASFFSLKLIKTKMFQNLDDIKLKRVFSV